jgi:NitT/TauT family transport system substrate-binding protein
MFRSKLLLAAALVLPLAASAEAKTIQIGIGHQSMCTDTYTAGIVIKEMKLLEKHLPKTGKYKDISYEIKWSDYSSGGPITNQMLANKLNIGVMGDYPLIVNGAKFQATKSLRSIYVAGTGYNLKGSGNAIVVPVKSDIYSIDQLKGKSVSTPVGSAAWGMLLKAMQDNKISTKEYELKNQAPAVGAANIATGKIDAHRTSARGRKSWSSAAPGGKSTTARKPAFPICTAWSCARISRRNIPKSSSPS